MDIQILEKNKTYYWRSPKDGMYYSVKLINTNKKLQKHNLVIIELSHCGFLTNHRKEFDNSIITKHTSERFHDNLELLLIEDIISMVRTKAKLDFPQQLAMLQELRELLEVHPDRYLKYMDILARDKMFDSLLDGKYNLKELPQDISP